MPIKTMVAPLRYVQGPGALAQLGAELEHLQIERPLVLVSPSAKKAAGLALGSALAAHGVSYSFIDFGGECTRQEIERVKQACLSGGHDSIISCGGGKCIDTGRAAAAGDAFDVDRAEWVSLGAGVHCINVPTVAANDGATSAAVVVYNDKHAPESKMLSRVNPTLVLVDTSIIAKSPVRLLVAGMGDALASYFQANMCYRTGTPSEVTQSYTTRAARTLARFNLDLLLSYGALAKSEAEVGVPGPALEAICEATILVSGLSFENGGISAAHAVGQAFYHIPGYFEVPQFHGELVAFGTLCQLVMEESKPDLLDEIFGFCRSVGLPTTLAEMTLRGLDDEVLMEVAEVAAKDALIKSMPLARREPDEAGYYYDSREVFVVIKATDAYGRAFAGGLRPRQG